jgi:hypothetical protein
MAKEDIRLCMFRLWQWLQIGSRRAPMDLVKKEDTRPQV